MNRAKAPWIIKYTIAVNIFFIICFFICALIAAFLGFAKYYPELISKAQESGIQLNSTQLIFLFTTSVIMWLLPVPLLLYSNRKILDQKRNVQFVQVLISLLLLFYFPIGTALHGIVLYYFLTDQKTKDYLTGSLKNV